MNENDIAINSARRRTEEAQTRLQTSDALIRRSDWRVALTDFGMISLRFSGEQRLGEGIKESNGNDPVLAHILALAIEFTDAEFENIQILDSSQRRLRIAASRGFEDEFLDYFAVVESSRSACGLALQQNCRVIVSDVRKDSSFNADSRAMVLRANALAVQSTSLISSYGRLVGMLSTHYSVPRRPPLAGLPFLDRLVRRFGVPNVGSISRSQAASTAAVAPVVGHRGCRQGVEARAARSSPAPVR